jgi:hypothetical protein
MEYYLTGMWRILSNEELYNLYSLSNIRKIKSGRMRWLGYVTRMGEIKNSCEIFVGNREKRENKI